MSLIFRVLFCLVFFYLPSLVYAQNDTTTVVSGDSLPSAPGQKVTDDSSAISRTDSMIVQPVASKLYWYDIDNNLRIPSDSSRYEIFRAGDEKNMNYVGIADLFRENALWFYFDLKENGRPAYMAPINLLPHQSALFYTGVYMNNPVHGMYNMQFLSVSHTQNIETDGNLGGLRSYGLSGGGRIQVTPVSLHSDEPWTRILYKQGTFGFSMLDISFAKSFSDKFSIQLGGFNNLYDGTLLTAAFRGTNFRSEITWQAYEDLYVRAQVYLDRHKVGLAQYEVLNEVARPLMLEIRDDYFLDITWFPDKAHMNRLHLVMFGTNYLRELWDENNRSFYLRFEDVRYGMDANYNLDVEIFRLLVGGGALYTRVWGTPFSQTYYPHSGNAYGTLELPVADNINIKAGLNIAVQKKYTPQINGNASLNIHMTKNQILHMSAGRTIRFPNSGERFFDFDTLYGNPDLSPETHTRFEAGYKFEYGSDWYLQADGGYHRIDNEIYWQEPYYSNSTQSRDFAYTGLSLGVTVWKLNIQAGGQYSFADLNITPRSSVWGKIHFHDIWLNGALIFDLYGWALFYDQHNDLFFDPRMDRFYVGDDITSAYQVLNWKAVATIQEARIFFEMDNALSTDYQVIRGYYENYIRWRFGIDWILWD